MSRQLWGCYAVSDHIVDRAFVADVLLYERLVIPVPPSDSPEQSRVWEKHWQPERQQRLLAILGEIAYRVPWSEALRAEWHQRWSAATAAADMQNVAMAARAQVFPGGVSPQAAGMTIAVISRDLAQKVLDQPDIRALAVYADAVRFDREWRIDRAFPFIRRKRRILPFGPYHEVAKSAPSAEEHHLPSKCHPGREGRGRRCGTLGNTTHGRGC